MKVSIIIPVYNKEAWIEKCLRCALAQDFDDYEVIAVDDQSTDRSGAICDQLAAEDGRLKVHHIANRGVTGARLYGLEQAQGEYVMFADSDDELLPNALSATYPVIVSEQADEVFGTYADQHGHHYTCRHQGHVADTDSLIREICNRSAQFSFAWAMLFRKEILAGCLDPSAGHFYAEDKLMQIKVLVKQPKVWFVSDCIYKYNVDIPNHWRIFNLEKDLQFEKALRQALAPRWEQLEDAYNMHRIKMYERYLEERDFAACRHYKDLRKLKGASLSLPSRIVLAFPPQISWIIVWTYRRLKRLTRRS